ncbi:DUF6233 domain-containing protein [Streptomyces bambusae]|uniref:DUF6233 domain-containing protein n=1 Tax=Streptomyces bambusae TaxID=1550616 RepID=UPI001CFC5DBD|nr:DUF6233 domain-containing protein [Streptomyces bambusae]MCB5166509.1 DUF6233 domain-containing protein [Streptomyces bambusae]
MAGPVTGPGPEEWAPIVLRLPDGRQRLEVRLYERRQDDRGPWMYRIGIPLWQHAGGGDVEPVEFRTWVTAGVLEPIDGVDLSAVVTHRAAHDSPVPEPSRWAWVVRPARGPAGRRGVVVHDHDCPLAAGAGPELGIDQALDAMLRPGAEACTRCDAAAVLLPALQLGAGVTGSVGASGQGEG